MKAKIRIIQKVMAALSQTERTELLLWLNKRGKQQEQFKKIVHQKVGALREKNSLESVKDIAYIRDTLLYFFSQKDIRVSVQEDLNRQLQMIHLLFNKEEFTLCAILNEEAYYTAVHYDLLHHINQCLEWQIKLFDCDVAHKKRSWEDIQVELLTIREQLMNFYKYENLSLRIKRITRNKVDARKNKAKIERFLQHKLLNNEREAISLRAKILFYETLETLYFSLGQISKSIDATKNALSIYDMHPHLITDDFSDYLDSLDTLASCLTHESQYEAALIVIDKIKALPIKYSQVVNDDLENQILLSAFCQETYIYVRQRRVESTLDLIPHLNKLLGNEGKQGPALYQQVAIQRVVAALYTKQQYLQVLHWVRRLQTYQHPRVGVDIQIAGYIIQSMIFVQLNKLNQLKQGVLAMKNYFKQHKIQSRFENLVVSMFANLSVAKFPHQKLKIYQEYNKWLVAILENEDESSEYSGFVMHWLKQQIRRDTVINRQKVKKQQTTIR
ncbi:MAG: hypothetical protein ACPGXL_00385 [Chitinophagales bacterium]